MAFQLLLNVLLAVCWMFLTNSLSTAGFITGFIAGLAALFFSGASSRGRFTFGKYGRSSDWR